MRLSDWMRLQGLSDDQVAEKVEVDRATISRIRRGKHKPSWRVIERLHEITGGDVGADDFLKPELPSGAAGRATTM